ncbi:hypothetical protein NQZ68_029315 [Dissostichus eleginoides]|nr:hypothetical protein NQZ68_029315 [Dissostichus eleginoides]
MLLTLTVIWSLLQLSFQRLLTGKISTDSFIKSFFEWEAVHYEVDIMCKEEPFIFPACRTDMLAVSVDGNRKHYRFKNAARSPDEVFVEDSGRQPERPPKNQPASLMRRDQSLPSVDMECSSDVTCKYWPYLQRVTKSCPELQHLLDVKPFLSVFHAKAHDFKCEVKWSGAYQEGIGLTLGEEVEQTTKALEKQLQNLESMKAELAVTEKQLEDWTRDVNEWAENSFDLRTKRRAFDLVMAVKRLEEGKKILVTEMNHHWKVLSTRSDSLKELSCLQNSPLGLSEDGMKGLQIMFRKKQHDIREIKTHARRCYLHVLTGAETISFLQSRLLTATLTALMTPVKPPPDYLQ